MKKYFLIPLSLACVSSAWAFNSSLKEQNSLSDFIFIPKEKTFVGQSELVLRKSEYDLDTQRRAIYSSTKNDTIFKETLEYFYAPRIGLGMSFDYLLSSETEITYAEMSGQAGQTSKTKASGLGDPAITGSYLLRKQTGNIPTIKIQGALSPKLAKNEHSSLNGGDGNAHRGGHLLNANALLSTKYADGQWRANLGLTYFGEQKRKDTYTLNTETVDSQILVNLGGGFQWDWTQWSLGVGLDLIFAPEKKSTLSRTESTESGYLQKALSVKPQWNILPQKLTAYFEYQTISTPEHEYTERTSGVQSDYEIVEAGGKIYSMGLIYQF